MNPYIDGHSKGGDPIFVNTVMLGIAAVTIILIAIVYCNPNIKNRAVTRTFTITLYSDTGAVIATYHGANSKVTSWNESSNAFNYNGHMIEFSKYTKFTSAPE